MKVVNYFHNLNNTLRISFSRPTIFIFCSFFLIILKNNAIFLTILRLVLICVYQYKLKRNFEKFAVYHVFRMFLKKYFVFILLST